MQNHARIVDGIVFEIWTATEDVPTPEAAFGAEFGATFEACGDEVKQGWQYVDGSFSPPPLLVLAAPIPQEIERHQALLALRTVGLTRTVIEAAIAEIADDDERDDLEIRYGQPRWSRDSAFIAWGQGRFGLSATQVDDLFRLAPTL